MTGRRRGAGMSRGHGAVQRWLLEQGLTEEPQELSHLAHRWYMHAVVGRECTGLHDCCDQRHYAPTRSEVESVRRAIKQLEAELGSRVFYSTKWWKGALVAWLDEEM